MNRTLIGILSLSVIGTVIVAMVQAQETADKPSRAKSVLVPKSGQDVSERRFSDDVDQSSSRRQKQLSDRLDSARDRVTQEYAGPARNQSDTDFPVAEGQPPVADQVTQEPSLITPPPMSQSLESLQPAPASNISIKASLRDDKATARRSGLRSASPAREGFNGSGQIDSRTALLTSQTPAVLVKAEGPNEIHVGQTATYRIDVANHASESLEDFYVRLVLPAWIQLEESDASRGDLRRQEIADGSQVLIWKMPQMQSQAKEHWLVKLVPQQNKPFDLNVDWWVRPRSLQAGIRVVKPELQLAIRGPSEMIYGQTQMFTLSVTNPGNGDADNVSVILTPGEDKPQWVGSIPAGGSRQLQFEISAAQAGSMQLRAVASADRQLQAEVDHLVTVRQPRLDLKVIGPARKYAGSLAKYQVILTNQGDAPANDILIRAGLPNGVTLIPGEGQVDAANGTMAWQLGSLAANTERKFDFNCRLETAGDKTVQVSAEAELTNMVSSTTITEVTGVVDLKLIVNDPQGPQMIGEEVVYEVQILNRGSKTAEQIKLVTQFSDHLEPIRVAGGAAEIVPGQALFRPLQQLQPGQQVTLKIFAKASAAGSHRFRAELTSPDPETKLVQEEMTRFMKEPTGSTVETATQQNADN
ncbi:MAG TPA: hypothetical protein EYN70_06390 [Planctomycetaceae bacterium]|nr:hypothetical protein [Planctomycetaceae bacterium]